MPSYGYPRGALLLACVAVCYIPRLPDSARAAHDNGFLQAERAWSLGSAGFFPEKNRKNRGGNGQKGKNTEDSAKSFSDKNWATNLVFYTRQIAALDDKAWSAIMEKATQLAGLNALSNGDDRDDADVDADRAMYSDPISIESGFEQAVRIYGCLYKDLTTKGVETFPTGSRPYGRRLAGIRLGLE